MITERLQNAINEQITAEMWSANLYLAMSFFMEKEGYNGMANWLKKQSFEEHEHAFEMASYIIKRGGAAKVDKAGNVWFKGTTSNFQTVMAMAADTVIVETEELVECGQIPPEDVRIPGILVDYIVVKEGK